MNSKPFFYSLGQAIYRLDSFYDEFAKNSGVSPTVLWILYALNDGKKHTQRDICENWCLPKSTVNTAVSELKRDGYVELIPVKGTRREMTVLLTQNGTEYAENVLSELYEREQTAFSQLDLTELRLPDGLARIKALLEEEL